MDDDVSITQRRDSQPAQRQAPLTESEHADLQEDLILTRILLESLDPDDDDFESQRIEFESRIAEIESRFEQDIIDNVLPSMEQPGSQPTGSQPSQQSTWRGPVPNARPAPAASDLQRTPRAPRVEVSNSNSATRQPQFRPQPQEFLQSSGGESSSSMGVDRKRLNPFEGPLGRAPKSQRATPSISGRSTPAESPPSGSNSLYSWSELPTSARETGHRRTEVAGANRDLPCAGINGVKAEDAGESYAELRKRLKDFNQRHSSRVSSMPDIRGQAASQAGPSSIFQLRSEGMGPSTHRQSAGVIDLTGDSDEELYYRGSHQQTRPVTFIETDDGFNPASYDYSNYSTRPPYPHLSRASGVPGAFPANHHSTPLRNNYELGNAMQQSFLQRGADSVRGVVGDAARMIGGIFRGYGSDSGSDYSYSNEFSHFYDHENRGVRDIMARYDEHGGNPEEVKKQINDLLNNIARDDETPREKRHPTPKQLSVELKEHQKVGLTWLKSMEEGSNKGGILADDMGLGKTIQALALMLERPSEDPLTRTSLIVAPVALMRQWAEEIESKVKPQHRLKVYIYHGSGKKADYGFLRKHDVVITTYGSLAAEWKKKERWDLEKAKNPNARRTKKDVFPLFERDSMWHRIILDEAQCIKNPDTKSARAALQLQAKTRFCMTGTPMMNGAHELFSLIQFLRIKPYCFRSKFNTDIGNPLKRRNHDQFEGAMMRLRAVLAAIMLRREKTSTIDGRPIISIPPKVTTVDHIVLSPDERSLYETVAQRAQVRVSRYMKEGTVMKNYAEILVMLLRLRQACCHPHLTMDFSDPSATQNQIGDSSEDDMKATAIAFSQEVIARIKAAREGFECPICYDGVENPVFFHPCGHDVCTECFGRITDPMRGIAEGREDGGGAKCPECRCVVNPKRVCDLRTFTSVHMPELSKGKETEASQKGDESGEEDNDTTDSEAGDSDGETVGSESEEEVEDDGDETLGGFIVPDVAEDSEVENDDVRDAVDNVDKSDAEGGVTTDDEEDENYTVGGSTFKLGSIRKTHSQTSLNFSKGKGKALSKSGDKGKGKEPARSGKSKGKGRKKKKKAKKENDRRTLAQLRAESNRSAANKRAYIRRLANLYEPSAKLTKCMEILENIRTEYPGEKVLVFSQFTTFLDLIEVPMSHKAHAFSASASSSSTATASATSNFGPGTYERYDGSLSATQRAAALSRFRSDPSCLVLLMSLKAGNAGLNLSCASHVLLLDPFWNPYVELQAVDRAHRYPQEREVRVHRLLVEDTVEDRIIELQKSKQEVVEGVLDEEGKRGVGRLGVRELGYLFGLNAR